MDLQTRKLSFIQEFLRIEDEAIIKSLEKMLIKEKAAIYEKNLKPMSVEHYNADIDQSLEDSENDRGLDIQDLKAEIKKWR
ncbi:hypothetical protein [Marixanthomonas spongiae]|uniref:Addiction module protein n=1 Tax=Marixanthomonas spongiae TaxID=2174845 RepID=A0A2U0HZM1_9FLAO|nr:hypothetical protein [Marixanthomonas spongiae]PVW14313.1 hypothetical protein DDV96_10970 [Marixanthomonas spongiae]